jgi:AraC-like DNA-binding protein
LRTSTRRADKAPALRAHVVCQLRTRIMAGNNWIDMRQDKSTEIETLRAHFEGHAYDPHWHDSYLLGYTEHGIQQFDCRRTRVTSTPGQVFMIEPGDIHDGHAPSEGGFTYSMLYLKPEWLTRELRAWSSETPPSGAPSFPKTLVDDVPLARAIATLFRALHTPEMRIVRQTAIDTLFEQLSHHLDWRTHSEGGPILLSVAHRARDYLHAHLEDDIGLDHLAAACAVDRFRLSRAFKRCFGLAPHAYLIQLRLTRARQLLALGAPPSDVAHSLCFADQSHLGRWFRRAYGLTPAQYGKRCTNLPDRATKVN